MSNVNVNVSNKSLIDECLIGCPLECESESYTFTVSSLDYPTKVFANYIGKKSAIMSRYGNRTPSYDELKGSLVKLNINFQSLQYTLVEESQKTTWLDLVSNVGGTLGLFTGFSFLSLVELLEIIFEICRVKSLNLFNFKNKVGKNENVTCLRFLRNITENLRKNYENKILIF